MKTRNWELWRFVATAIALFVLVISGGVFAATVDVQDKPALQDSALALKPSPQPIPADAQRLLSELQLQAAGLERARAVLQRELDVVAAEWSRTVARVQQAAPAGYELDVQTMTYVAKKPKDETTK